MMFFIIILVVLAGIIWPIGIVVAISLFSEAKKSNDTVSKKRLKRYALLTGIGPPALIFISLAVYFMIRVIHYSTIAST